MLLASTRTRTPLEAGPAVKSNRVSGVMALSAHHELLRLLTQICLQSTFKSESRDVCRSSAADTPATAPASVFEILTLTFLPFFGCPLRKVASVIGMVWPPITMWSAVTSLDFAGDDQVRRFWRYADSRHRYRMPPPVRAHSTINSAVAPSTSSVPLIVRINTDQDATDGPVTLSVWCTVPETDCTPSASPPTAMRWRKCRCRVSSYCVHLRERLAVVATGRVVYVGLHCDQWRLPPVLGPEAGLATQAR